MVPKGWDIKLLGEITCYINRGIQPMYIDNGGIKVINQKCIRNHQIDWTKARRHDPNFRPINGSREVQKGDLLINSTGVGTLGRVAQILCLYEKTIVDSHVTIVRADPEIITWNVLGLMLFKKEAEIEDLGEGTTGQTELSRERLKSLKVLVPSIECSKSFDKVTLPLRDLIRSNEIQIKTLADIREVLLPKLLSGEVRVKLPENNYGGKAT
jgi:type I restriction enzyme S subunit